MGREQGQGQGNRARNIFIWEHGEWDGSGNGIMAIADGGQKKIDRDSLKGKVNFVG